MFKRHSCSELTYVHSVGKDMAMKKGRDQLVRTRRPLWSFRCWAGFGPPVAAMASSRDHAASQVPDSVLLVVQSIPFHLWRMTKSCIACESAKWPVTLRFSRPLTDSDVTPLARCLSWNSRANYLMISNSKCSSGSSARAFPVKKHGSRTVWQSKFDGAFVLNRRVVLHAVDAAPARWRGDAGSTLDRARAPDALVDVHTGRKQAYDTVVYLNETMLFWRVRDALKQQRIARSAEEKTDEQQEEVRGLSLKYDLTKGVGLYDGVCASGKLARPSSATRRKKRLRTEVSIVILCWLEDH